MEPRRLDPCPCGSGRKYKHCCEQSSSACARCRPRSTSPPRSVRFLAEHPGPVRFVNVDCDLYSSTRTVLALLAERIVPGSVLVFDEYLGYEHWREDEFRAFQEAAEARGWRYRYLCYSFATKQAAVQITG